MADGKVARKQSHVSENTLLRQITDKLAGRAHFEE